MSKPFNNLLIKKMVELSIIIQIHKCKSIFKFKIIAYYVFLVLTFLSRFYNYDIISSLVDCGSLGSILSLSKTQKVRL